MEEIYVKSTFRNVFSITAVACALTVSLEAADGVLIASKTVTATGTTSSLIQMDRNRMRTEMTGTSGTKQIIIYDGVKHVLYTLDDSRKTYTEMSEADVAKLAGEMQGISQQMEAAMAKMTPEQRAQMEAQIAMMSRGRAASPAAPVKTVYKKTGTGKVGRWSCDTYEGYQGAQKTAELCTVNPSVLGFTEADFEVTRKMAAFYAKLAPQSAGQGGFSLGRIEEQGFSGFPVRQVSFANGSTSTSEVTDVSRQTFADALFGVPDGYQKAGGAPARGRGRGGNTP